jgi:heat shock protein HslJ
MNKRTLISLVVIIIIVLCLVFLTKKPEATAPAPVSQTISTSYSNGTETVNAEFDNTNNTVTFTELSLGTVTLPQAMSGSGARYANADGSIVFWEHQGEATITKDGTQVFQGAVVADDDMSEAGGAAAGTTMPSLLETWVWQRTDAAGGMVTPKKADAFTITFGADGRVSGTTDCNGFMGSYTAKEGTMTFSPLASTLKFCDGSQENVFTGALAKVNAYSFDESGNLVLALADNGGTMQFKAK